MPVNAIFLASGWGTCAEVKIYDYVKNNGTIKDFLEITSRRLHKRILLLGGGCLKINNGLTHLKRAEIKNICLVIREDYESLFRNIYNNGSEIGFNITYAIQKQQCGILDAIKIGIEQLRVEGKIDMKNNAEKFIVISADNVFKGDELTNIFKEFSKNIYAKSSVVSLQLPQTREVIISKGHTFEKDGLVKLKWGIQYKWLNKEKCEKLELVEKPTLDEHQQFLKRLNCEASALSAYYLFTDSKGPNGLLDKIELLTNSAQKGIAVSCIDLFNKYIHENNYSYNTPLKFSKWSDIWEETESLNGIYSACRGKL